MPIRLKPWFKKFCNVHGLDPKGKARDNKGVYGLRKMINDSFKSDEENYYKVSCFSLDEWHKYLKEHAGDRFGAFDDFLYEKATGYVLCNLNAYTVISHEVMAGCIVNAIEKTREPEGEAAETFSEKYGFLVSSVGDPNRIYIGDDYKLSPEEKLVFKTFKFIRG
jgi:hypothetical protein